MPGAAGSKSEPGSKPEAGPDAKSESAAEGRAAAGTGKPPEVLAGDCESPEQVALACGERAVVVHDAKALGTVPPGLVHDTLLGAYLLEPARRGYPFAELCEERGLDERPRGPGARPTRCCWARSRRGSASRSPSAAWRS